MGKGSFCAVFGLFGSALAAATSHAAPIVIDNFTSGEFHVARSEPTTDLVVQTGLSGVIGGRRSLGSSLNVAGTISGDLDASVQSPEVVIRYDRAAPPPTAGIAAAFRFEYGLVRDAPLDADLTADGNDRFRFTLTDAPRRGALVIGVNTIGRFGTGIVPVSGPGTYDFRFSDFMTPIGSFNFADTDSISIAPAFIDGDATSFFRFSSFQVVPEPSAVALLAAAAMLIRRREKPCSA